MSCVQNVVLFRNLPKTFQNSWFVICSGLFLWRIVVQASPNEDRRMQKRKCLHVCHSFFYVLGMTNGQCFTKIASHLFSGGKLATTYIVIFIYYILLTFLIIGYTLSENELRIWVPFFCHIFSRSLVSLYFSQSSFSYPHVCCESMKNEFRCHLPQRAWMM